MDNKDVFKYSLAGIFSLAVIVGFFMGLVPSEVFVGVAGGIITYVVTNKKHQEEIEALKSDKAKVIDLKDFREKE